MEKRQKTQVKGKDPAIVSLQEAQRTESKQAEGTRRDGGKQEDRKQEDRKQEDRKQEERKREDRKQEERAHHEWHLDGGYVPSFFTGEFERQQLYFENNGNSVTVSVPHLTGYQLEQLSHQLLDQRIQYLSKLRVDEIVERIAAAIHILLDRQHELRRQAEQLLPLITGYAAETIRLSLTNQLKPFRKQQLYRFLQEDFSNYTMLDEFRPSVKGGFSKAYGARLAVHIWAGNVPGLPLWSIISSLLVKSSSIGKLPSAEPLFAGLFVKALALIDQQLADCLAIVWWKGGDTSRESKLFEQGELVLAYGSDESLAEIRSRIPSTTRFIAYGHKLSFALIGREALNTQNALQTARAAAWDIVCFDQQGCYSPQLLVVEDGGLISPRQFAHYLSQELAAFTYRFPRRKLSLQEQANLAQVKQMIELRGYQAQQYENEQQHDYDCQQHENEQQHQTKAEEQMMLIDVKEHGWTVVYERGGRFQPGPLHRFVRVLAVSQLEEIVEQVAPYREYLQSAGLAVEPSRLFSLAELLGEAGVTRISTLGRMSELEPGWHHDGRFNLLDLVRVVDIELNAERAAEKYANYRD